MHKLWLLASTAGKGLLQCVLIAALTFLFCRTIPGDAVDVRAPKRQPLSLIHI